MAQPWYGTKGTADAFAALIEQRQRSIVPGEASAGSELGYRSSIKAAASSAHERSVRLLTWRANAVSGANNLCAMSTGADRLAVVLRAAARGVFPNPDGRVEVLPAPHEGAMAVLAFTSHHFIATDAHEEWIRQQLRIADPGTPMSPRFLSALGDKIDRRDDGVDVLLSATGLEGTPALREMAAHEHPPATRADRHRTNLRVFTDSTGAATLVLGRGLVRRSEVAVEVDPTRRRRGIATRALIEARRLTGTGEVLFARIAPGNAASLRAFLSAGFHPIGSEALFLLDETAPD